ncbi:MAG: glycosyltransferase family 4 protein [Anaerolineales bacterium]
MKIALIAPTYLPARRANTFQVMKMAQGLVAIGHKVRVAVPAADRRLGRAKWEDLADHYGLRLQFPVDWLAAHPNLRRYDFGLRSIFWARSWKAELIYTRLPQAAALASMLGIATIFEVHDIPQGKIGPFAFHQFVRGRGARRLVVISRALLEDLVVQLGAPSSSPFTIIAPDGIDLQRYRDLPSPRQARLAINQMADFDITLSVDHFTVGYTGHLYPGRGVELLIELAERLPEITFLLVGGEQNHVHELANLVKNKGLSNVILTGFVSNTVLPDFQAASDVLLMPYQYRVEASSGGDISRYLSPMKMFEYLACGRAIISSDLPVLREVLNSESAVLLSPDDVCAWAKAIIELCERSDRRENMSNHARRQARQYTWEKRASRILEGIIR